jgi:hypothetical protein
LIVLAFAFAELVDNALAATAGNKGLRKIEIQLVGDQLITDYFTSEEWVCEGIALREGGGGRQQKKGKGLSILHNSYVM